jgi:hypothetical protein
VFVYLSGHATKGHNPVRAAEVATLFFALTTLPASLPAAAQPQEVSPSKSIVTSVDPTDFFTRIVVRNEYRSLQSGREMNLFVPRLEYAFSKTFQVWLETPFVHAKSDDPGVASEMGLGDILLRGAIRAARGERYAVVVGAEVIFDTASEPMLGTGNYQFAPLVFASIEVPRFRSTLFPFYQHYFSIAGDNSPDINYASIRPSVILTKWPNRFYTVIDPNFFIDFERDMDSGMMLEFEIGRGVSENVTVWIRPGVGVYGDIPRVYDWNLEGGIRYYFR